MQLQSWLTSGHPIELPNSLLDQVDELGPQRVDRSVSVRIDEPQLLGQHVVTQHVPAPTGQIVRKLVEIEVVLQRAPRHMVLDHHIGNRADRLEQLTQIRATAPDRHAGQAAIENGKRFNRRHRLSSRRQWPGADRPPMGAGSNDSREGRLVRSRWTHPPSEGSTHGASRRVGGNALFRFERSPVANFIFLIPAPRHASHGYSVTAVLMASCRRRLRTSVLDRVGQLRRLSLGFVDGLFGVTLKLSAIERQVHMHLVASCVFGAR